MRVCYRLTALASLLLAVSVWSQAVSDPVADLFTPRPPLPPGVENQPGVPLRSSENPNPAGFKVLPSAPRPVPPRRPPLQFNARDRVLFLGDAILEAEAKYGYLETRMEIQAPTVPLTFWNLSASPNNRLRDPDPKAANRDFTWFTNLLAEVRALDPNVVVLSYGTAAALNGPPSLPAFTNVYEHVIEGLLSLRSAAPPRLVLLSPLGHEPAPGEPMPLLTNRMAQMFEFAVASWHLSTNRQTDFVDLFGLTRIKVNEALKAETNGVIKPRITEDGLRPTAYGQRALTFALDRGLHWFPNNWRFALMANNQWRPGGFGAQIASNSRTDHDMRVVFTEEMLPCPPPPVPIADPEQEYEPHCYIQLRDLVPGRYELRVDGQRVLAGTHEDWARYEVIASGPSWDQAEKLRQKIVEKNARWTAWWQEQRARGLDHLGEPPAEVRNLEKEIATLRRPTQRTYEVVRVGDVPAATNQSAGAQH